jgi:hypothetical protein
MAVGLGEAGILVTGLRSAALAGVSQAAISGLTAPVRREAGLPVDIMGDAMRASATGHLIAGSMGLVASEWTRKR